ncbi:MAG: flavohemoglobin expression-modulating QEGLA motif protein [Phycisphaerales bacterium]|nr:MAG: flavohemoglobin expression-modulating QEGLA motif protein [Phycisphaerales bacterium]
MRKVITARFIDDVCKRVREGKRVRRALPIWGRIQVDRPLPVVCVYRRPVKGDDPGTAGLVTTEPSYILASGSRSLQTSLKNLLGEIVGTLCGQFGAVLILELWAGPPSSAHERDGLHAQPRFRIHVPRREMLGRFLDTLEEALSRISVDRNTATVEIVRSSRCHPMGSGSLAAREPDWHVVGLEVAPVYRSPGSEDLFPIVLRTLRRQLSRALQRSFYQFTRTHTTHRPPHYQALGRRVIRKVVFGIDRQLAEVADGFDFLLQVTPVNSEAAWRDFQLSKYSRTPNFHYRPLAIDPPILKRRLFKILIERVEDPAIADIFRQKRDELDRQITMLGDINSPRFMYGSVQLYGNVEEPLLRLAEELLQRLPRKPSEERRSRLGAEAFAERAEDELRQYAAKRTDLAAKVEIRDDIGNGLMVSRGALFIGKEARIPASRVEALLQHEIGTHVLTYYNGRAQPLRQLYSGLAGYEALQEGIAVLSEYLVGGLSRSRLRLLAARVLAAHRLLGGAPFIQTFTEMHEAYGFEKRTAFSIALRVYRGGGLTKDAVYLRGLCQLLEYLKSGGDLEPLLVGKIAFEHIPIIRELRRRGILREPPLRPRYMDMDGARERLALLRNGMTVLDLIRRYP